MVDIRDSCVRKRGSRGGKEALPVEVGAYGEPVVMARNGGVGVGHWIIAGPQNVSTQQNGYQS